eukprot:CAMPEP_0117422732 /NCGR_PEP_ID=MMETSP0758-20121206/3523_1 /TAXON_ID=63605 /ORGANISM="Percolomonas cosmopolitus, Strain AE-1 (ATCC 50343)" /LENGTH=435 /DNA_ID=CAMNT_0005205549 /DNA_START=8 /DNA_END=1315 /DNA_ORIENTATION=-
MAEKKEHINIVFIGHVDAGKSTLGGQILYKMGQVDERTIQKYEREAKDKGRDSWYLAYIMDCSEEEKEKGKTVQVARASFESDKKKFTILDAPGHKAYVPNMIGGASQADVAILIISARRGEFEAGFEQGGQTREHSLLAKTLGVEKLVVVINKMDEPTVEWSEKRYEGIRKKLKPFFKKLGYSSKNIAYLPLSGLSGANLTEPIADPKASWYKGKTFVQTLDDIPTIERDTTGPVRVPIIDKFKDRGAVVALGKIESGVLKQGDTLLLMPNAQPVEVSLIKFHEDEVETAHTGENVQIYLKNVNMDDVQAGFVLSDKEKPLYPVREFIAQFLVLELNLFTAGFGSMMHIHTATERMTVKKIMAKIDKKTGEVIKGKNNFGKSGDLVTIRCELDRSVCLDKFESCAALGRFTLRGDTTFGVGKIMKIKPITSGIE